MDYNSKTNLSARKANSKEKGVAADSDSRSSLVSTTNEISRTSGRDIIAGTSADTSRIQPGSSKNSVVIRWLNDSSSDEGDSTLNVKALIAMRSKQNERKRIEKLGNMVPLAKSMTRKMAKSVISLPELSTSRELEVMVVRSHVSSQSDTNILAIPTRRKMGARNIRTNGNIPILPSKTENSGRKSSMSSPFRRASRKVLSFGVVETQIDEPEIDETEKDEEPVPDEPPTEIEILPEDPEITLIYRSESLS